jgi:hypothetical protein
MSGHRPLPSRMQRGSTSIARREGTRTPEKHKCPGQKPEQCSVEILTTYSHTTQAADLRLCHTMALTSPVHASGSSGQRPWSLCERLDERDIAELITAYRDGATAASLALLATQIHMIAMSHESLTERGGSAAIQCAQCVRGRIPCGEEYSIVLAARWSRLLDARSPRGSSSPLLVSMTTSSNPGTCRTRVYGMYVSR